MIIAILPAYNAEKTLEKTVNTIPAGTVDKIILVDDASKDNTVGMAKSLGLETVVHSCNRGYGGNQKTCYRTALKYNPNVVVMIHPDFQYHPKYVPELINPILKGECDAVFGSRMIIKGGALKGGMPKWKYLANIILTKIENFVLGTKLTEFHSGFRAYSGKLLSALDYEKYSDKFVFDTEIIIQLNNRGFKIKEIPIETKYFPEASSVGFLAGMKYALSIFKCLITDKLTKKYN